MDNNKYSLNDKLINLVEDGLSIEDAASCLGLDIDQAKLVIIGNNQLKKSGSHDIEDADKIIAENKPRAIKKLIRIGFDDSIENISARVTALKTVIEYKPLTNSAEDSKIAEMYKKMTEVSQRYEKELAEKKSMQNTTVVIPNTTTGTTVNTSPNFKEKFDAAKEKEVLDYAV